ncbi:MAG: NAD(P)H-hydrate dehydratase [Prevotellaceae bacterium]|nr:NAD(P)H-hydrate dehydratase [Prevotellaceae bacterium]
MKVLSTSQMRALDEYNIKTLGVESLELMERASRAVVDEIVHEVINADSGVMVFAGPGNNGGDGLAIARMLADRGYSVKAFLFNTRNCLSDDCMANRKRLAECEGVELVEITSQFDFPSLNPKDIIIDALFGTGLSRPLSGGYAKLVGFINRSGNTVVSVDVPSGMLDVDTVDLKALRVVVKADYTYTFHSLKPTMLLADNREFLGVVKVLDIGLDDSNIDYTNTPFSTTGLLEAREIIQPLNDFAHKGTCGHGLLVAGSYGMAGASVLAAKAALKTGLGKLTLHTPINNLAVVQTAVPEAVVDFDSDQFCFTEVGQELVAHCNAVAIGPGLGKGNETIGGLFHLLEQRPQRLIVDADALNILSLKTEWASLLPKDTIITPHRREWQRLLGVEGNELVDDTWLLAEAMKRASDYGIYIVLKGHFTAVCCPGHKVFFNTTGNAGMATAGSGDVLTGIILALRARGYSAQDACRLGVWLHGKAGDCYAEANCRETLVASDLIDDISKAYKTLYSITI